MGIMKFGGQSCFLFSELVKLVEIPPIASVIKEIGLNACQFLLSRSKNFMENRFRILQDFILQ